MLTESQLRSNLLEQDDGHTQAPEEIRDLILDRLTENEIAVLSLTSTSHAKLVQAYRGGDEKATFKYTDCYSKDGLQLLWQLRKWLKGH